MNKKFINYIVFLFLFVNMFAMAQDYEDPHAYLDWKQIETEHFFVNYHPGAENTARITAKIAEEIFPAVTSVYNYKPDTKVSFIIKDYSDNSNGASYFFDNKIEIWASSMDFDLRGTHNWLRNVLTHEYTHMIQLQTAMKFGRKVPALYLQWMNYESERRPDVLYGFPNVLVSYPIPGVIIPAWFAEGVAQYNNQELQYDFWDSHRDMILRSYILDSNMLSWEDMGVFGKTSLGNESSYNAGFSIVQYISEHYGFDKVKEISYNMAAVGRITIDGAIEKALGKTGKELYNEWKESLKKDYSERIKNVKANPVVGEIIANIGFGNFFPCFSPDGTSSAYTSNKTADYFGLSGIYVYDPKTKTESEVTGPVRSQLSFSPDGKNILYSRYMEPNTKDEIYYDLFVFDSAKNEETRLTFNKRAYTPAYSPDGKKISFLSQIDGTINLYLMDSDGRNIRKVTNFKEQEQIYSAKWSADGKKIVFSYSVKDGRDVAIMDPENGNYDFLVKTDDDERDPAFSSDGKYVYYSSDKTGIFNIYRYELESKNIEQMTNVPGGAFMPAVNKNGDLAFALYTSTGYKISYIKEAKPLHLNNNDYIKNLVRKKSNITPAVFAKLNNYDDTKIPDFQQKDYKNVFGSMSFFPVVRIDNYNTHNKGIDVIKPGIYFMSNDVLDKYGIFGGASINRQLERDLFFTAEYNDKLPLLSSIGLNPKLSIELYNITRKTSNKLTAGLYIIPVDVSYSMLEFDASLTQKIFNSNSILKLNYKMSRYTSTIGKFVFPETNILQNASDDTYLVGYDYGLDYSYKHMARSKTSEINPIGMKIHFKLDYELNRYNKEGKYEVVDGMLKPNYQHFDFPRVELKLTESIPLPGWLHTLTLETHMGAILGPPVAEFFDFYVGGFSGMKGYPFYGVGGNEFARVHLSYKFPLFDNIDLRVAQIYFSKLYLNLFSDFGNAWTDGTTIKDFKKDTGLELRLETFSWYAYPTRIFVSGAYGFDSYSRTFYQGEVNEKTVNYGKEWRFYLGILFGFEIFDVN